jgi:iron complex transport system ATP-binding protein
MAARLEVHDLAFAYRDQPVFDHVSFHLQPGEVVGLVGPNGSGKSTLLRLLLGILPAHRGRLLLDGKPIRSLSRRAIARHVAFVPQDTALDVAFTTRDIVAMGRNPYLGRFQPETAADQAAIEWALAATSTQHLTARWVQELSGGERQRVMLARALAQQAPVLLLDEPTANLDVAHQLDMLSQVRSVVHDDRCALMALHDFNLAARFCDRILMLANGRLVAQGKPAEVITEPHLATYFHIRAKVRWEPDIGALVVLPCQPIANYHSTLT